MTDSKLVNLPVNSIFRSAKSNEYALINRRTRSSALSLFFTILRTSIANSSSLRLVLPDLDLVLDEAEAETAFGGATVELVFEVVKRVDLLGGKGAAWPDCSSSRLSSGVLDRFLVGAIF